jgi:GntR family transcriptional regulator
LTARPRIAYKFISKQGCFGNAWEWPRLLGRSGGDHLTMARFRLELGPIPLHHQVYLDLRRAITDGELRPGDRLPPERTLAERYGCSLITVRRALSELARERRLERTRGRGTFVLRPRIDRDLAEEKSFTEEMQVRGFDPETRLVAARPESAGEAVANALGLEVGSPTLYLERLRLADGEPLLLEQVHLPAERFPGLLASDLERNSLYDLLTERYGTHITRARETLEPVLLQAREARLLGRPARSPALLVEGIAFAETGLPVEFGRTYVRGDRTRYYVERVVVRAQPRKEEQRREPIGIRRAGATRHPEDREEESAIVTRSIP